MKNIRPGEHGSTYGGNSLACAIAQEAIQVLLDENMVKNSEEMGKQLLNNLQELKGLRGIKDVRGKGTIFNLGLFLAIEFDSLEGRLVFNQSLSEKQAQILERIYTEKTK